MAESEGGARFRVDAKTLFVLGNGPSLRSVRLPALSGRRTLGMNAAYRYWRMIDWRPSYYACLDLVVGLSHKEAIAELIEETRPDRIEKFLLRGNLIRALGEVACTDRVVNFDSIQYREPPLGPSGVTTGSHSALWGASVGYQKIVILGVDGQYVEFVDGAKHKNGIELEIVEETENPNYFFEGYQKVGDRYCIPNPRPDLHISAWREAARIFAQKGVTVVNGNKNSAVQWFPFVDVSSLLDGAADMEPTAQSRSIKAGAQAGNEDGGKPADDRKPAGFVGWMIDYFRARPRFCALALLAPPAASVAVYALSRNATAAAAVFLLFAFLCAGALVALFFRSRFAAHIIALQRQIDGLEEIAAETERQIAIMQRLL